MEAIIVAFITIVPACITAFISFRKQGTVNTSTIEMSTKDMDIIRGYMVETLIEQKADFAKTTDKLEAEIKELDTKQKEITKALSQALSLFAEILASENNLSAAIKRKISNMINNLQDLIK